MTVLGGTASGTYTEHTTGNFMGLAELSAEMGAWVLLKRADLTTRPFSRFTSISAD